MYPHYLARAGAIAAALALPALAAACDPDRALAPRAPPVQQRAQPALGPAAAPALLERARGGADVANTTTLGGVVSGNGATKVVTGANVIQTGSFANMSGMPIVVQNSGANVLIQNATVINLQLK